MKYVLRWDQKFKKLFSIPQLGKNGKQKSMENQPVIEDKPEGSEISLFGMKEFMWGWPACGGHSYIT